MSQVQDRRVRKLRLAAGSEDRLQKGRILLEDGFHTASFPGLPAGRLTIIKHFPLGRFSHRWSAASLARLIEQKFAALTSQAVSADHPNAGSYPVVYFRDEIEPCIKLALRIAGGEDTSSWFWPLAVKAWRPAMSSSESLRAILFRLANAPPATVGLAALVAEMRRRDLLHPLLNSLQQGDGESLLQLCGWTGAAPEVESVDTPDSFFADEISPVHEQVLRRVLKRWSPTEARSVWLTAILLVEENPVRVLDRRHLRRAQSLIDRVARRSVEVVSESSGPVELSAPRSARVPDALKLVSTADSSSTHKAPSPIETNESVRLTGTLREQGAANSVSTANSSFTRSVPAKLGSGADAASARESSTPATASQLDKANHTHRLVLPDGDADQWKQSPLHPEQLGVSLHNEETDRIRIVSDTLQQSTREVEELELPFATDLQVWPNSSDDIASDAQATEFAGFYFLLPLISQLGLATFLEQHPDLIELDFPARLLRFAAKRLRIPEDDPILTPIRQAKDLGQRSDLDEVVRSWYRAMVRWSRRYLRLRLGNVVRRRGSIAVTRTHLDLFFDLNSVNILIRRAGLDLDPGWVPWFGRVVSFHYLEKEQTDDRD